MSLCWRKTRDRAQRLRPGPQLFAPERHGSERTVYAFPSMKLTVVFVAEKGKPLTIPVR